MVISGLFRNLSMLATASLASSQDTKSRTVCHVRITPLDCGLRVLKSDRYLQLAEAAQVDYLVKTGLMRELLRRKAQFVNASVLLTFSRPIAMFARARLETALIFSDEKCAYFSHSIFVGERKHAEVLVKMKFKRGSVTVRPSDLLDCSSFAAKPTQLVHWDQALARLA